MVSETKAELASTHVNGWNEARQVRFDNAVEALLRRGTETMLLTPTDLLFNACMAATTNTGFVSLLQDYWYMSLIQDLVPVVRAAVAPTPKVMHELQARLAPASGDEDARDTRASARGQPKAPPSQAEQANSWTAETLPSLLGGRKSLWPHMARDFANVAPTLLMSSRVPRTVWFLCRRFTL